jgi:type IV pilus assembly protein PilQ
MDEQQSDGLAGIFRAAARIAVFMVLCVAVVLLFPSRFALARPVTLHAVDADVRAVLASVAELGGVGLVLDDSVQGTITIHLDEAEPEEAFEMIAAAADLSLGETGGVAIITASRTGVQGLYRPYVFPVRYADLDTVAHAVALSLMPYDNNGSNDRTGRVRETDRTRLETENGSEIRTVTRERRGNGRDDDSRILADSATGSIVLYGTASEAKAAEKLIAALDQPQPQVSLEAKVIAIDKNAAKDLGVEWEWSRAPQYPDYTTEYETRRRTVQNPDGSYTTVTEDVPRETVRRYWDGSGSSVPGIIRFGRGPGGFPFEFY